MREWWWILLMISLVVVNKIRSFFNKNVNVTDFFKRQNYTMTNLPINKIIFFTVLPFDSSLIEQLLSLTGVKTRQNNQKALSRITSENNLRKTFLSILVVQKQKREINSRKISWVQKLLRKKFSLSNKLSPKIIFQRLVQVQKYKLKDIWKHDVIMSNHSLQQKNRLK